MGLSLFDRITQLTDFTNRRRLGGVSTMADAFQQFTNTQFAAPPTAGMFDTAPTFGTEKSNFLNDFVTAQPEVTPGFDNKFVGAGYDQNQGWGGYQNAYVNPFGQSAPGTSPQQPGTYGGGGAAGNTGIGALDAHNAEFNNAMAKFGAPANLLKAMVNRESSGNWERDGGRVAYLQGRNDYILPFVGITKRAADSWGLNWDAMIGNKQAQIDGMATIVAGLANKYGGFDNAIKVYFGGEAALQGDWKDENGLSSNYYYTQAKNMWQQFDALGGGSTGGSYDRDWSANFGAGAKVYDWGDFGVDSDNGYYGYSTAYGLNGRQHTGLDITGVWNATYTSPVSGTVTCGGTGNGAGADGGGCAAYAPMDGRGGAGRIEVQLDNGAVLIFGHSQGSFVRPGQRINVGDALGTIGWANSDHVHLEARVRDPSTPSGWRIVDPRTVLGGGGGGGGGAGGTVGGASAARVPFSGLIKKYLMAA